MSEFAPAFNALMVHEDPKLEGVVVPEPKGGQARFGINSLAHPEAVADGFYSMSHDLALAYATSLYRTKYFEPIGGFEILNQIVCNKYFDLAVNMGIYEATLILQRAINFTERGSTPKAFLVVTCDGKPGPKTIAAINATSAGDLMTSIRDYATQRYADIARSVPEEAKYLNEWLSRLNS